MKVMMSEADEGVELAKETEAAEVVQVKEEKLEPSRAVLTVKR